MPAPSRRILLYWLLLLLPTLAVGVGALYLLRREQARLDEQAREVAALRRETVATRARQIAESVELLIGDVQSGLMATLDQAPATGTDEFLNSWGKENALVKSTFRLGVDGRVARPTVPAERRWLVTWLVQGVPWQQQGAKREQYKESESNQQQRKDISSNVGQNLSLRNSLQEVARSNQFTNEAQKKSQAPAIITVPERKGWASWREGSIMHMVGWRQPSFGGVVGVEVNLSSIVARFGELLPRDGDMANAFEVREAGVVRQSQAYREGGLFSRMASSPSRGEAAVADEAGKFNDNLDTVRVPLSATLMPGWEVVGLVDLTTEGGGKGGAFFVVGALLVGSFIVAILSGGALLLHDARRSEAEAAQKTSFVANVSHEFKTPLTTIRLYAELLEQGRVRDREQGGDYLRTIGRETQRLARLVNNVLDFSRLEQGKKKYTSEAVDLGAELGALIEAHSPRVAEAGLTLKKDFPEEQVVVNTDRDALEQIVLNLIDNACKYAGEGGEVTVELRREGAGAEVRVLDRGAGVPAAHAERIFEKFHRVDDTLTAEKSGAGLGLSIARQLARGLGGDLHYEPREGGGAVFILSLP